MRRSVVPLSVVTLGLVISLAALQPVLAEYISGLDWPEPAIVTPGETDDQPPSDAIVLFDGTDLSAWNNGDKWIVQEGVATASKSGISTKQSFGDCQLHIEWASPAEVKGSSQGRGNSGVYLMGKYEVQVLDSFDNKTYFDGQAGAIYKQKPPDVNACRGPGKWQTYDIIFTAPRFAEGGELQSPAYLTVLHNGVLIQNHVELKGGTEYLKAPAYKKHPEKLPISLQFHGNPVQYRNIWIRELATIKPSNPDTATPRFVP